MTECVVCAALPVLPGDPLTAPEDVEYRPVRARQISPRSGPRKPRCETHQRAHERAKRARQAEARVMRTYNLEPGEYDQLYVFQGGTCAICQKARGVKRRLAVDHDHGTDEPRGLLCSTCNYVLLGRYGPDALHRALAYLDDPPYQQMKRGLS